MPRSRNAKCRPRLSVLGVSCWLAAGHSLLCVASKSLRHLDLESGGERVRDAESDTHNGRAHGGRRLSLSEKPDAAVPIKNGEEACGLSR